ncbi:GntR family transcriptional regulator [Larkinella soli]|uniref:GntR family transcriptional regulator n=1 Tax=Larkinella soli TaxID=1770527 RepID=UPI000FFB847B|nr:GntR family transcriptional regulator [Larkinella soli]
MIGSPVKNGSFLQIDESGKTPKFLQIVNGVISGIETGVFKPGDRLPSINETSAEYYLARATVEKAYGSLLKSGHITSLYRKGFFVADGKALKRVLFLVGRINDSSHVLFNALSDALGRNYRIDMFAYEYRKEFFCDILDNQAGKYHYYVVMPHHLGESDDLRNTLRKIPNERLFLLEEGPSPISRNCSSVGYGCGRQFRDLLEQNAGLFGKYRKLNFVTTDREYIPADWYSAFLNFTNAFGPEGRILDGMDEAPLEPGNAYLLFDDEDLVETIRTLDRRGLKPGRDIGLLSFNDAGYKALLAGGISVIRTDFSALARQLSDLIASGKRRHVRIPLQFIHRPSL